MGTVPGGKVGKRPGYRADIDGLRAVAVLLVLGDHLRTHVTGGYVGVDLFFVISGYLISAHILAEMEAGRFSLVSFYERRVRRIFPALLVMLAGTTFLAYRTLFPTEFREYAQSLVAALLSVSNMLFWHQAGYFDTASRLKPLLHTWSLAVEEQFYLFFPLFLFAVRRWLPGRVKAAIWAVAAITFALACWYAYRDATAAFFFAPLRAWELLLGTVLSQGYLPRLRGAVARNVGAAAGLLMIAVPALKYTQATVFPGLAALVPCVGAVLIILAGERGPEGSSGSSSGGSSGSSSGGSAVGWLLSLRPVVFVGLISYSLYLWHWPLIVFQEYRRLVIDAPENSTREKLAVLAASMVLGTLSWWLVETPFRAGRLRPAMRPMFAINAVGTLLLLVFGAVVLGRGGLPGRFPPDAIQAASFLHYDEDRAFRGGVCFLGLAHTFADYQPGTCLTDGAGAKNYLLMGDSHAAQLWPGLHAVDPAMNLSEAATADCKPYPAPVGGERPACAQMSAFLYGDYLLHHRIDTILLAGRWYAVDFPRIATVVAFARAHGIRLVVIGPMMEYDLPYPRLLAQSLRDRDAGLLDRHRDPGTARTDAQMRELARGWGVPYVSILGDFCTPGCPVYGAAGVPLLFDTNHLTVEGSELLARRMRELGQVP